MTSGRYAPISQVDPSLPTTLDAWFARALSPIPTQRFATAQEMAETFLSAARGRTSRAPAPVVEGAQERQGAWLRVLPLVVGGLAVLALASGILLGLRTGAGSSPGPARTAAVVEVAVEPLDVGSAEAKANANAGGDAKGIGPSVAPGGAAVRPTGAPRPPKDRGF